MPVGGFQPEAGPGALPARSHWHSDRFLADVVTNVARVTVSLSSCLNLVGPAACSTTTAGRGTSKIAWTFIVNEDIQVEFEVIRAAKIASSSTST